jgi:hypothetical protein
MLAEGTKLVAYSRNNGGMILQGTAAALAHCIETSHSCASKYCTAYMVEVKGKWPLQG